MWIFDRGRVGVSSFGRVGDSDRDSRTDMARQENISMKSPRRLLIIEDDPIIVDVLKLRLETSGFECISAESGEAGLKSFYSYQPDLVLVDVGLPGIDGFEVIDRLRDLSDVPVIFITARGTESDKVRGLRAGGDDYIVKPFGGDELIARIEAQLRRSAGCSNCDPTSKYEDGEIQIDLDAHEVSVRGAIVNLTAYEYRMLTVLLRHPKQVLSQEQILDLVWGSDAMEAALSSVRLYIGYLRSKIERNPKIPRLIKTVRGFGYKYDPPSQAPVDD